MQSERTINLNQISDLVIHRHLGNLLDFPQLIYSSLIDINPLSHHSFIEIKKIKDTMSHKDDKKKGSSNPSGNRLLFPVSLLSIVLLVFMVTSKSQRHLTLRFGGDVQQQQRFAVETSEGGKIIINSGSIDRGALLTLYFNLFLQLFLSFFFSFYFA